MIKKSEERKRIESLITNRNHLRARITELNKRVTELSRVRMAASVFLDALRLEEPTEKQLKVLDYLVRESEICDGQAMKFRKEG